MIKIIVQSPWKTGKSAIARLIVARLRQVTHNVALADPDGLQYTEVQAEEVVSKLSSDIEVETSQTTLRIESDRIVELENRIAMLSMQGPSGMTMAQLEAELAKVSAESDAWRAHYERVNKTLNQREAGLK